jgi:colicin import membrane protein
MPNSQSYKIPVLISVLLHIVILMLLFVHWPRSHTITSPKSNVIQAIVLNEKASPLPQFNPPPAKPLERQLQPLVPAQHIQQIEQTALHRNYDQKKLIQPAPQPDVPSTSRSVADLNDQVEQPLPGPQKTSPMPLKNGALAVNQETNKLIEQKRKEDTKRKKVELAQKRHQDKINQLQHEIIQEQREAVMVKTQAPEPQQQVEEDATNEETAHDLTDKTETQHELQDQVANERHQISDTKSTASEGDIDKFKQMIVQAISRKWLMPDIENAELTCKLLVHVGPGGEVLSIDVLQESGAPALDRSAHIAIMKASPLPVPENSELFDKFRALRLTFRPQGIVSG